MSSYTNRKLWIIKDFGTVNNENALWLHCEDLHMRDTMDVGTTCILDFKTGMGRNSVEVTRVQ